MEGLVSLGSTIACIAIEELNFARQINENFLLDVDEKITRDRSIWVRPNQTEAIWTTFDENLVWTAEWVENFGMSRNSFYILLNYITDSIEKQDTNFRMAIKPAKRLGIALHYYRDEGRMRKTAKFFDVGKSTVSMVVRELSWAITRIVGPLFIKLPTTEEEVQHLCAKFEEKLGFPNAWSAIDGTHEYIPRPSENPIDYLNRKNRFSLNVQAMVDYEGKFVDVAIYYPG